MINKKVILSTLTMLFIGTMVVAGTYAFFNSVEATAAGSSVAASSDNPMKLAVTGTWDPAGAIFTKDSQILAVTGAKFDDSEQPMGFVQVANQGSQNGELGLSSFSDSYSYLDDYLKIYVYSNDRTTPHLVFAGSKTGEKAAITFPIDLGTTMNPGDTKDIKVTYELMNDPSNLQNNYLGLSSGKYTFGFTLNGIPAPKA